MSDVLFRYLLTARQRERSVFRRLFLADDPLLEAGVEQLVETASARVGVKSQHERVSRRNVTVPASRRRTVRFYDVAMPNRPHGGRFERRSEEFPLKDTLQVFTCTSCGGSGEVRCGRCSGRRTVSCSRCSGAGKTETSSGRRRTCRGCGGSGRQTCGTCGGSGRVTCRQCRGEGRLAGWEVEVYLWLIEERSEDELPLPADETRVGHAFNRWLKTNKEQLTSFEPASVVAHLGFDTKDALAVAARADARRRRLEDEAKASNDRYLFHRTDRWIAPVGYTVVRLDGKARFYWLVGRGDKAREVTPSGRPDGLKCLGWLGAGTGSLMGYEGVALAYEQALPLLESLQLFGEVPSLWLAGGSAASWLLTLTGVRRVRLRKPPVLTIGLIVEAGRPTVFLTCLAYLGSYLGHLRVLDRAYDIQSERLLGRMRPNRQSESLGIELADGRRIRLVEVANPQGLSAQRIRLMAQALDAVMILKPSDQTAAEGSAAPLQGDLGARIAAAGSPSPRIGSLRIDDGASAARDLADLGDQAEAALPLEAVRRAFVRDVHADVDWQGLYDRMWRPLDDLLKRSANEGTP